MVIVPKAQEDRKGHKSGKFWFSLNPTPDSGFDDSCELLMAAGSPRTQWVSVRGAVNRIIQGTQNLESFPPLLRALLQLSKEIILNLFQANYK